MTCRRFLPILVLLLLGACSRPNPEPITPPGAPVTVANADFAQALALPVSPFLPDLGYAPVNSKWLAGYYDEFRADLHRRGVVKWEGRFDCNKFATAYASGAQMRYFRDSFHSWAPTQALAVGEIWFRPTPTTAHAVNIVLTERGPLVIEPQTGRELVLTEAQRASVFYCRF